MAAYIIICGLLYVVISAVLNKKRGYITAVDSKVNWLFQFGPLVLAQFLSEWVARMIEDYDLIDPYCEISRVTLAKMSITSRFKSSSFKKSLLPNKKLIPHQNRYRNFYTFCTIFLFNYQAVLFTRGPKSIPGSGEVEFVAVSASALLAAFNGTTFGPPVMQAMYHGLEGNNLALNTSLWTIYTTTPGVSSTLILPFQPVSHAATEATLWKARGSAISMGMKCSQVQEMALSIAPETSGSLEFQAVLTDRDGCVFTHKHSLQRPLDQESLVVAVWDQLKGHDDGSPSSCPEFRQFAYVGQVPSDLLDSAFEITSSDERFKADGTFGAVSCDPYFKSYENIPFRIDRRTNGQEAATIGSPSASGESAADDVLSDSSDLSIYKSNDLPRLSQVLGTTLASTIFLGNLTRELVDPVIGNTFWGGKLESSYKPWYEADSNASWNCSAIKEFGDADWNSKDWTNDQACMLYGGVKGIYISVASLTAGTVAQFIPKDKKITGSLVFERLVWSLNSTLAFISVALHLIALMFLVAVYLSMRRLVTGLYGNPASIAAKMFYFRHKRTRDLFRGLDIYSAKDSIEHLSKRLDASTFKWKLKEQRDDQTGQRGWVFIKRKDARESSEDAWLLPAEQPPLDSTRFSEVPGVMQLWALISVQLFIVGLIGLIFALVLRQGKTEGFHLWAQSSSSSAWRTINEGLFSWIPALVLTGLRIWWGVIDKFFRQAQPFEQLKDSAQGATTLCTQYLTQPDIFITYKAWRQKHRKLGYVTIVTLIAKIAIVASGKLFDIEEGWASNPTSLSTTADWRKGTFAPIQNDTLWGGIQRQTLAGSMSAFPGGEGWSVGPHSFIPVHIPIEDKNYTAALDSISSFLECLEVDTKLTSENSDGSYKAWSLDLSAGNCTTESLSIDICKEVITTSGGKESTEKTISSSSGGCYTWSLLPKASCGGVEDFWLISAVSSSSPIQVQASKTSQSGQLLFSVQPKVLSILCKPRYTQNTVLTSIVRSGSNVALTPIRTLSSEPIEAGRFMSQSSPSMDFSAYFSTQLDSSTLVNNMYLVASGVAINPISAIMAFNMTAGIDDFHSFSTISTSASRVYSLIFAAFADIYADSAPFLFELLKPENANMAVTIPAKESSRERRAMPQPIRIYIVCTAFFIYGGSIFLLLWWRERLALPQDITSLGGQMILLYRNSVMREIERKGVYEPRWLNLRYNEFKLGISRDGEHLGVDIAENVDSVPKASRMGELRRRVGV